MNKLQPADAPKVIGFWQWLMKPDDQGAIGLSNLFNRWSFGGFLLAVVFSAFSTVDPIGLAKNVALPATGGLIGLSFAWAGRSSSLLQDKEFSTFIIEHGPPIEGYVYSFQLAILTVVIFTIVCASLLAGGTGLTFGDHLIDVRANRFYMAFSGFIALRECWGAIYFSNKLTIQFYRIKKEIKPM
ncbi:MULTISPECIES: hypothetical protein [unclassified Novosphingobium]|uniref:hypothetical protein n=1 Tax=unclassified Novosphingobium TaxID=2644732 RepID=UPI0025E08F71|nr:MULTISPECIES: hypothetical protein [unclassified Novosphingobium]HQV03845.1 hypothetical protein [Novosphingobium sp.]